MTIDDIRPRMNWAWVLEPSLATGSMPLRPKDAKALDRAGVTHVLNVADDWEGDREATLFSGYGITYQRIPTRDTGVRPPDAWFEATTSWALDALESGGSLYIHCLVGSARGPSIAYATLRRLGFSHPTAFAKVRSARPEASLYYVPDAQDWLERAA